jgi:hypothetical protein
MSDDKKQELLYLLDQLNKYLFELEQELEDDIEINTDKWKEYYLKLSKIHSVLSNLHNEIYFS